VLGGDKFVESQTEDNSGALVAKLKQTKGAISYLALSFKDDSLLTLSIKTDAGVVERLFRSGSRAALASIRSRRLLDRL